MPTPVDNTNEDPIPDLISEINRIRDTPGYVYLLRNKDLYKIGITMSLQRRIRELKPDEVLEVMQMPNTRGAERILHARFKHKRVPQTEYFRLSNEEVQEARYLFRSVRGEKTGVLGDIIAESTATLKRTAEIHPQFSYSDLSTEWIRMIRQISNSCSYEKMLWTETTTSTGMVVIGSYYILNALDRDCVLPRSSDLLEAVKRIEVKDDYLLSVAKAETEEEAAQAAITLIGDLLLALCWGYWQSLFAIETMTGEHPRVFIEMAEQFLKENNRWYTLDSPTRRKRLEQMRGWNSKRRFLGLF